MNKLKKNISIILFQQQIHFNQFIFFLAESIVTHNYLSFFYKGLKYVTAKNNVLPLDTFNSSYAFIANKQELLRLILQHKHKFIGVKFKNLYFDNIALLQSNYLQLFTLKGLVLRLKVVYFFFLRYIFAFSSKFK